MFEDYLIEMLEASVKKNGEIILTNKHLLNIIKLINQRIKKEDYQNEMFGASIDLE